MTLTRLPYENRPGRARNCARAAPTETDVFMDGGGENVNGEVNRLLDLAPLRRVLAQVDVSYSNSLIEVWRRSLRHRWLYLNSLDNLAAARRLVWLVWVPT